MSTTETTGFGWYSAQQKERHGSVIYETTDGRRIEVTEVSATDECPNAWPDTEPRGPVSRYVGRASSPTEYPLLRVPLKFRAVT